VICKPVKIAISNPGVLYKISDKIWIKAEIIFFGHNVRLPSLVSLTVFLAKARAYWQIVRTQLCERHHKTLTN